MTAFEAVAAAIAAAAVSVPIVTWVVLRLIRRDRIFVDVPPGEIPADPDEAPTRFISHGAHYSGEVVARTTPPAGVGPGLAGVVIDGSADGRDIAAMILDLARRGWLQIDQVDGPEDAGGDWTITRLDQPLDATLDRNEVHLLVNLAPPGGTVALSVLCSASDDRLGRVQLDLHREVAARGWYPAAPHQTSRSSLALLGVGGLLGLVIALIGMSAVSIGAGAVIVACAYLTSVIVRGGTQRTALGTAVRIQALGLRRYIEEAQSYQFSYTDALDTFRRYLPWAVVFQLEGRWAQAFATLDVAAQTSELHFARDPRWFARRGVAGLALPPAAPAQRGPTPRSAPSGEDVVATVLMNADQLVPALTVPEVPTADAATSPATPTGGKGPAAEPAPATAPVVMTTTPAPQPRTHEAMFSDWLDDFDLAMAGEIDAMDPESTEGGTVITGPQRFDVLLTPPLWPDVPLVDTGARVARADLSQ